MNHRRLRRWSLGIGAVASMRRQVHLAPPSVRRSPPSRALAGATWDDIWFYSGTVGRPIVKTTAKGNYDGIEIAGEAILPVTKEIGAQERCAGLLRKHGLDEVKAGEFHPLTKYLALLNETEKMMPTVLRKIGESIGCEGRFPTNLVRLDQVLSLGNQIYYMNHRGCKAGEIGYYQFERKSDQEFILTAMGVPVPCPLDTGIFLGYGKKLGVAIVVEHVGVACRGKGDAQCTYRIRVTG